MAKKKKSKFTSRIAIAVVFLIAVVYTCYHVISLFSTEELNTIASGITTERESIGGRGYIFRDEMLLTSENTGAVDYLVGDGERVSKSAAIADVYSGGGRSSRVVLKSVNRQIELLEKSKVGSEPLDLATLRAEANNTYYTLMSLINSGQAGELAAQIDNIMITLNKINVLSNGEVAVQKALDHYYNMRKNLLSGTSVSEYSEESGYFYYYPDGYEEYFSISALDEMDQEYYYGLESYLLSSNAALSANVYGKLAPNSSWYFALALSNEEAERLEVGNEYRLVFPDNNNTALMMTFDRTVDAPAKNETICVFYCNKLPNNFKLDRAQNVEIDIFSVSGIYVPRSAIKKVDDIRGVYVLRGSVVHFRTIKIIYEGHDYVLVSPEESTEGGFYSLGTNELIITNGVNLFDGRILD